MSQYPDTSDWHETPSSGSWLCADGPYGDRIAVLSSSRPGLFQADPENSAAPLEEREARVTLLTLDEDRRYQLDPHTTATQDLDALRTRLHERAGQKNVWLVSNLNRELVALLGGHFKMDTDFFLGYERTSKWRRWSYEPNLTPSLPSITATQRHHVLRYCDLRDFGPYIDSYCVSCADAGRFVHRMKQGGRFESPSIVDRKCAYWDRKVGEQGWDVVILCDPPLRRVHVWPEEKSDGESGPREVILQYDSPFQGGYCDFMPQAETLNKPSHGPPRTSLLDDLSHYLLNHAHDLPPDAMPDPSIPLFFLQKILASHYMQLLHFTTSHLLHSEQPLIRRDTLLGLTISWAEARWSEIQDVMSRCNEYIDSLEALLLSLHLPADDDMRGPAATAAAAVTPWWDTALDFQRILHQARGLKARAEGLNTAFTGLTGIVGNAQAYEEAARSLVEAKRSVREAKNMKVLTFVAMFFIPLAFTSGLFSMSDAYIPGGKEFWVYFAVSVPLIVLVFAGAFVADMGYDEDGKWALGRFGYGLRDALVGRRGRRESRGSVRSDDGSATVPARKRHASQRKLEQPV